MDPKELHKVPAFICSHIFKFERPVLCVSHADGDWQFVCGEDHEDGPRLVGLGHLITRDPSLADVLDLPVDYMAERSEVGAPWIRTKADPE
jgi:hypothetical protein